MYQTPLPELLGRPRIPTAGGTDLAYPYPAEVISDAPIQVEDRRFATVQLRVPFASPPDGPIKFLPGPTRGRWHVKNNHAFDIFFTVPVRVLADPMIRFTDLLIMFNGLNEIMPWHSALYDLLGHALAEHGIATVLLPTPFHLNRTPQLLGAPPSTMSGLLKKPTATAKAYAPWVNFYQSFLEIDALVALIRDPQTAAASVRHFYAQFAPDVRISLFGFSMGGLRALTKFLIAPDEAFHRCILLCSGATLKHLSPPDIPTEDWVAFAKTVERAPASDLTTHGVLDAESFRSNVDAIFFKDSFGPLDDVLTQRAARVKAIFGSDDIKMREGIPRLDRLVGSEIIFGMKHLVTSDPYFEREFPRISSDILTFLKLPVSRPPQTGNENRDSILTRLATLQQPIKELTEEGLVDWARRDEEVGRLYVASKARNDNDGNLIESLRREQDRRDRKTR